MVAEFSVKTDVGNISVVSVPAHQKYVVIDAWVNLTRANEPTPELAHALEHYTMQGTESIKDREAVYSSILKVGGSLHASTGNRCTSYMAKVPIKDAKMALRVILELLFRAKLAKKDLEKVKKSIHVELSKRSGQDDYRVHPALSQAMYEKGTANYRDFIEERLKSLDHMSHAYLKKSYEQSYCADNIVIGVSNQVSQKQWSTWIRQACKGLKPRLSSLEVRDTIVYAPKTLIVKGDKKSALLNYGGLVPLKDLRHRAVFSAATRILGSGPTSFFAKHMRTKHKLSYLSYISYGTINSKVVQLYMFADCNGEKVKEAELAIQNFVKGMRRSKITAELVKETKDIMIGKFLMADSLRSKVESALFEKSIFGTIETEDDYLKHVKQIRVKEVQDLCMQIVKCFHAKTIVGGI